VVFYVSNKNLGGRPHDQMQAHHLIPEEVWGRHKIFFNKIGMKDMMDAASNGLLMPDSASKASKDGLRFFSLRLAS